MENEIQNTDNIMLSQNMASESDLEQALRIAARNEELARKIKILAIKQTNSKDWVDQGGTPRLQSTGAEKIARLFGISWRICEGYPLRENLKDDGGTYYVYSCKGEFIMGNKSIEFIGTCSQRDKFFGKENGKLKIESEIDITNIMKKAYTNMEVNGVLRMLGLRNLTWEDLAEAGIKKTATTSVNYKSTGKEVEGQITNIEQKSGKTAKGEWKLFNIYIGGTLLKTFDTKLGEIALMAAESGEVVKAIYKNDGKGNVIETLEIIKVETKKEVAK